MLAEARIEGTKLARSDGGFAVLVIPAYQPPPTLVAHVSSLRCTDAIRATVVVDDGSGSEHRATFDRLAAMDGVHVLRHAVNLGKGAALKTGLNFALAEFPDQSGTVTADADGQHHPDDVASVARSLVVNPRALTLGVRRFDGSVPWRSRFGNTLTRRLLRVLVGQDVQDTQTGLRGIPRHLVPYLLKLDSGGYEFELDMLIACKYLACEIRQEPIRTIYLDRNRGSHFSPFLDSMRIYFLLFRFTATSLITALIDNAVFAGVLALGGSVLASQATGRLVALAFNYNAVRNLVFYSRQRHAVILPKYLSLVVLSGAAAYGLIQLLVSTFAISVLAAKVLAETLLFIVNFVIQRDLIFSERRHRAT
jgi:putative flippase GtrA